MINAKWYMRIGNLALVVGIALSMSSIGQAQANSITLFNTGLDGTGNVLSGGSIDSHWTLFASPDSGFPGPDVYVANDVYPIGTAWIANTSTSKWVAPRSDVNNDLAPGVYTYRTTFDLTGLDPATASITGQYCPDNTITDVIINGTSTGISGGNFLAWVPFSINSGFVSGTNTVDFVLDNSGWPDQASRSVSGFRAELTGTASTAAPVPEPSGILAFLCGAGSLVGIRLRRRN